MHYLSIKTGVNSSGRFPCTARTLRHRDIKTKSHTQPIALLTLYVLHKFYNGILNNYSAM